MTLVQSVVMNRKVLEVKKPSMNCAEDILGRILDGLPGSELSSSMMDLENPTTRAVAGVKP